MSVICDENAAYKMLTSDLTAPELTSLDVDLVRGSELVQLGILVRVFREKWGDVEDWPEGIEEPDMKMYVDYFSLTWFANYVGLKNDEYDDSDSYPLTTRVPIAPPEDGANFELRDFSGFEVADVVAGLLDPRELVGICTAPIPAQWWKCRTLKEIRVGCE